MSQGLHISSSEICSEPFSFTGIVSWEPFYYIAGIFRRNLDIKFRRMRDFEFYNEKLDQLITYPIYVYADDFNGLMYFLLLNKCTLQDKKIPIVEEFSDMDMILWIMGRDYSVKTKEVISQLKKMPEISASVLLYETEQDTQDISDGGKTLSSQDDLQNVQTSLFDNSPVVKNYSAKENKKAKTNGFSQKTIDNLLEEIKIYLNQILL